MNSEEIEQAILKRIGRAIDRLQVIVEQGTVRVYGRTTRYYNKQLVSHLLMDNCKDKEILNEIEVV